MFGYKKFFGFLVILSILMIMIGGVSASDDFNETFIGDAGNALEDDTAESLDEDSLGSAVCVENKTFEGIQQVVDSSQPNDTIELEGVYEDNGSGLAIAKDLTFEGKGNATLKANQTKLINVGESVKNLTFRNIKFFKVGIFGQGDLTVNFVNCSFDMDMEGSLNTIRGTFTGLNFQDSSFENSQRAMFYLYEYYNRSGSVNFNGCRFSNIGYVWSDYTIDGYQPCANVSIRNSLIKKSLLSLKGSNHLFDNCTFDDCERLELGDGRNVTFKNSKVTGTFVYFRAIDSAIRNTTFKNCSVSASGSSEGRVNIRNSTFITSFIGSYQGEITVDDCTFRDLLNRPALDVATGYGGYVEILNSRFTNIDVGESYNAAIYFSSKSDCLIENCSFTNNKAKYGGAIAWYGDDGDTNNITITGCTFTGNQADFGGAISLYGRGGNAKVTIANSSFVKNKADVGSAIWLGDAAVSTWAKGLTIDENCIFKQNTDRYSMPVDGYYRFTISQSGKNDGEVTFTVKVYNALTGQAVPFSHFDSSVKFSVSQFIADHGFEEEHIYESIDESFNPSQKTGNTVVFKVSGMYHKSNFGEVDIEKIKNVFSVRLEFGINGDKYIYRNFKDVTIEKPRIFFVPNTLSVTTRSNDKIVVKFREADKKSPLYEYFAKYTIKVYQGTKLVFKQSQEDFDVTLYGHTFNAGTYRMEITASGERHVSSSFTKTFKVNKMKTKVSAPKVTAKFKKAKYFKVTVKQQNKSPCNKVVKIKVKIGKKTYTLKTDKKGVAKFNTKSLKVGKYAVKITSADSNYVVNGKSTIIIKK